MMCTCAKQKHVASDRARRENVTVKNTTNIEREELRQMKTNTDLFEKTPVPKAVATMAVPTMISMLVVVIYNMADTFSSVRRRIRCRWRQFRWQRRSL